MDLCCNTAEALLWLRSVIDKGEFEKQFSAEGRRVQTCDQESRPKTRTDRMYTCVSRVIFSGCISGQVLESRRHYTQLL
jgi:hypothetical protein